MFFIIGRINDFDMDNSEYLHWTMVREIQMEVADSDPRFTWINTDDLSGGEPKGVIAENDLHFTRKGTLELARRFANAAMALINSR